MTYEDIANSSDDAIMNHQLKKGNKMIYFIASAKTPQGRFVVLWQTGKRRYELEYTAGEFPCEILHMPYAEALKKFLGEANTRGAVVEQTEGAV